MGKIVAMGYATNNGQTGREYKIKITTCSHFSHFDPQTDSQYTSERSHFGSHPVVTFSHFEQDLQNFSDLEASINTQNSGDLNPNGSDEQISNNAHDFAVNESNLSPKVTKGDYEVTTKVTTPKSSHDQALNPKVTKVTTPIEIRAGDKVRYRGRGENGLFTLKGLKSLVLTVLAVLDDMVQVSCPEWLTSQNIPAKDLEIVYETS